MPRGTSVCTVTCRPVRGWKTSADCWLSASLVETIDSLSARIDSRIAADWALYIENQPEKLQSAFDECNIQSMFHQAKKFLPSSFHDAVRMQNKDGNMSSNYYEDRMIFLDYFSELLEAEPDDMQTLILFSRSLILFS